MRTRQEIGSVLFVGPAAILAYKIYFILILIFMAKGICQGELGDSVSP